ncbi:MAG: hypothetical protein PHW02_00265, partial [bacterium]|nr:hypothetical protein [bacterium]
FSENGEKYNSTYKYHEDDYISSSRNGYYFKAYSTFFLKNSQSLNLAVSSGYTHDKTAPSHTKERVITYGDSTSDTLYPKTDSPLEIVLDPFNLFEYDDFMKLEYETLSLYNDYPYMTLYGYEYGINGYYFEKDVLTNSACIDYSMPLPENNRLTAGAGVKQRDYSQTDIYLPWDMYYFNDTYSTSSLFAYGFLRNCFERNKVLLDMNAKADFVSRSGVLLSDSLAGESKRILLSYRFSIRSMINEYSSIRFSAEKAIQQIDETYLFANVNEGFASSETRGDPYLNQPSSDLYDFGISFDLPSGIYLSTSIYYREIQNLVNLVRIETVPFSYRIYSANGSLYGKGFELLCGAKSRHFDIEANYTYTTVNESLDSLGYSRSFSPDYLSKHKINILHSFKLPFSSDDKDDLLLSLNHQFRSGLPADRGVVNYYILPNLYLADMALVKEISFENRRAEIYLNVSNLFNAATVLDVYSNTLEPDKDWTEEFDPDTFGEYRIGDVGYDVRKDSDRDGFVSSEENCGFTLGMYYDAAYDPNNYTTPREFAFGIRITI